MKIALSGKGGVGKTTLSAMLSIALDRRGQTVLALDADPDSNLAAALGVPRDKQPVPLAEMRELIAERTGSANDYGGYFKLNPKVDDIPTDYATQAGDINLLVLGGVREGGAGCICPASAMVKALLTHLIFGREDSLVMDMEAGIEHLGRATASSMDALVLVVNDSSWSIETALRVKKLAGDLGITRLFAVANRTTPATDLDAIAAELGDVPLIGHIPFDEELGKSVLKLGANGEGSATLSEACQRHLPAVEAIISRLESELQEE